MATRPEHTAPPEVFYGEEMAGKYAKSTRMIEIQTAMAARCVELLNIPEGSPPQLLLDVGCGSGLSGAALAEAGHRWVGLDISKAMLDVARARRPRREDDAIDDDDDSDEEDEEEFCGGGDLLLSDMGHGCPFRAGVFDGAISVSALQWLCNADRASHNPVRRMRRFFETLFACLRRSARAVFQVYPETPQQMELLTSAAMRAGFTGGLLVDYPHSTRAKKYYLVLFAGPAPPNAAQPKALLGEGEDVDVDDVASRGAASAAAFEAGRLRMRREERRRRKSGGKPSKKSREWVLAKKDRQRVLGAKVRPDTKYTARKRKRAF